MLIFMSIIFLALLFCLYMAYRCFIVGNEIIRLLEITNRLANNDMANGLNWRKRFDTFKKLDFDKMMWQLFTFKWELPKEEV